MKVTLLHSFGIFCICPKIKIGKKKKFGLSEKHTKFEKIFLMVWTFTKGLLISKCLLGVIILTKKPTKFFEGFLLKPLTRGRIKNFIIPNMLNNP